jgi:hypothetical protein
VHAQQRLDVVVGLRLSGAARLGLVHRGRRELRIA